MAFGWSLMRRPSLAFFFFSFFSGAEYGATTSIAVNNSDLGSSGCGVGQLTLTVLLNHFYKNEGEGV